MRIFERWYFGLCWDLRLTRVIISWRFWFFFQDVSKLYFCMVKYLIFYNSSFALRYILMQMARPQRNTPIVLIITSVNPVHNAPVPPPPPRYLLWTGSNLSSCTVVVNAPRSCWPNVIQKKKDKKRSKYVALDFSAHYLLFIIYFVSSFLLI